MERWSQLEFSDQFPQTLATILGCSSLPHSPDRMVILTPVNTISRRPSNTSRLISSTISSAAYFAGVPEPSTMQ